MTLPFLYRNIDDHQFASEDFARTLTDQPRYGSFIECLEWTIVMHVYAEQHSVAALYSPSQHEASVNAMLLLFSHLPNLSTLRIAFAAELHPLEFSPVDAVSPDALDFFPSQTQLFRFPKPTLETIEFNLAIPNELFLRARAGPNQTINQS